MPSRNLITFPSPLIENDETKRKIPRSPVIEAPVSEVTLYIVLAGSEPRLGVLK